MTVFAEWIFDYFVNGYVNGGSELGQTSNMHRATLLCLK